MSKKKHTFNAIYMDKIANINKAPQARKLAHWFLGVSTIARQAFARPYGAVKVLLGMPSRSVHCNDGRQAGNLRLNKSVIHPGWVLTGCLPTLHPGKKDISSEAPPAEASSSSSTTSSCKDVGNSEGHECQKQLEATRVQKEQVHQQKIVLSSRQSLPRTRRVQGGVTQHGLFRPCGNRK